MDRFADLTARHADDWATLAGHAAWQGAVVGLAALAVVALGRRWPAPVRYWILILALVKFAVPPLAAFPTGLFSLFSVNDPRSGRIAPSESVLVSASAPGSAASDSARVPANSESKVPVDPTIVPGNHAHDNSSDGSKSSSSQERPATPGKAIAARRIAPAPVGWRLPAILLVAHLAGTGLVLALFLFRVVRLQETWRWMLHPDPDLTDMSRQIARQLGLRRVPSVRLSRDTQVPYSAGILHPVVILPAAYAQEFSRAELQAILSHELAHHRRGDLFINLLQVAIEAAWWFHPVVWLLNRAIRGVREECCDDMLLTRKFVEDESYCTTLLHVAQTCRRRRFAAPISVSIADGLHPLAARIRRIMDESLPRRDRPGAPAAMVLVALAAVILPGVRAVTAPSSSPTAASPAAGDSVTTAAANEGNESPREAPPEVAADETVGGRVTDEKHRPVAKASVKLWIRVAKTRFDAEGSPATEFEATTGADGTWLISGLPANSRLLSLQISHPECNDERRFALDGEATKNLRELKYERILQKGAAVIGKVTDDHGRPMEGATVALGQYFDNFEFPMRTTTAADGAFRLDHCPVGDSLLTVLKVGLAPQMRTVAVKADGGEFNVALIPGRSIRIRVKDQNGEPVANAFVWPFKWPDTSTLTKLHNFGKTDENGIWTWDWAPDDELAYSVRKAGYLSRLPDVPLRPGTELYELILLPERRVTVKVVDDATDRPVPKYRATLGLVNPKNSPPEQWQASVTVESSGGACTLQPGEIPSEECVVQIEADGYHAARSRIVRADEDDAAVVVRLRAAGQREAVVFDVDKTPAARAAVFLGTETTPIDVLQIPTNRSTAGFVARTGDNGRFRFDVQTGDFTIFAIANSGFGYATRKEISESSDDVPEIRLKPWARIDVTLRQGGKFLPDEPLDLGINRPWPGVNGAKAIVGLAAGYSRHARTDRNGRFVFDRVPSEMVLQVGHLKTVIMPRGPMLGYSPEAYFKTAAGEVQKIALGGSGRTVIGRFTMKDEAWAIDWGNSFGVMDPVGRPGEVDLLYRPCPMFQIEKDGSFRLEEFPPGKYKIATYRLALKPGSSLKRREMSGLFIGEVSVPELAANAADEPVDLGMLPVGFSDKPK